MDLYAENILDHYRNPRGKIEDAEWTHAEENPTCGDDISIFLKIDDGKITQLQWGGVGCAISQAAMSILFEELEELSLDDVLTLSKDDMFAMLGVPISMRRTKCALLAIHTLKNAILSLQEKPLLRWVDTTEI